MIHHLLGTLTEEGLEAVVRGTDVIGEEFHGRFAIELARVMYRKHEIGKE